MTSKEAIRRSVNAFAPPRPGDIQFERSQCRRLRQAEGFTAFVVIVQAVLLQTLFYALVDTGALFAALEPAGFEIPWMVGWTPAEQGHALMGILAATGAALAFANGVGRFWLAVLAVTMGTLGMQAMAFQETSGFAMAGVWVGHLVAWYSVAGLFRHYTGRARDYGERLKDLEPEYQPEWIEQGTIPKDREDLHQYLQAVRAQGRALMRWEARKILSAADSPAAD